jgi:hypothetical protein
MSKRGRTIARLVLVLLAGGLLVGAAMFRGAVPAIAHVVPSPCDFTTGGGWIRIAAGTASNNGGLPESDQKANFGIVGGCKPDRFFGHVNYVDHNNGVHVSSDSITGYVNPCPGCDGRFAANNARDICGTADVSIQGTPVGTFNFRVRTIDAEQESFPPPKDKFGILLQNQTTGNIDYLVPTRCLADDTPTGEASTCNSVNPGGGDIELHKPAPPNTTGPSSFVCPPDTGLGY